MLDVGLETTEVRAEEGMEVDMWGGPVSDADLKDDSGGNVLEVAL